MYSACASVDNARATGSPFLRILGFSSYGEGRINSLILQKSGYVLFPLHQSDEGHRWADARAIGGRLWSVRRPREHYRHQSLQWESWSVFGRSPFRANWIGVDAAASRTGYTGTLRRTPWPLPTSAPRASLLAGSALFFLLLPYGRTLQRSNFKTGCCARNF